MRKNTRVRAPLAKRNSIVFGPTVRYGPTVPVFATVVTAAPGLPGSGLDVAPASRCA